MNYCTKCKRDLPEGTKCPVCEQKKGVFVEMDMPSCCAKCDLPAFMECGLKENAILCGFANAKRHNSCPLQEVKE